MNKDMTVPCEDGLINLRVGAIIMKNGKILMVGNDIHPEAIVREVFEETGVKLGIDRLGFVHENYFYGDIASNLRKLIYEISYFYYMKVPDDFEPVSMSMTEDDHEEFLRWIDIDDPIKYYPEFFRSELLHPEAGVKHFVTDER